MIRKLELDKNLDKYVLYIENETPLKQGTRTVGYQTNILKQVWNKEDFAVIRDQVNSQKIENEQKLKKIQEEIKGLPKLSEREAQQLKDFKEKLEKVQDLNKLEQLKDAEKNHVDALKKIEKDLEELDLAINGQEVTEKAEEVDATSS